MYPSRKYRNHFYKKQITKKLRGGDPTEQKELTNKIETAHPGLIGPAFDIAKQMGNTLTSSAINSISKIVGVDITNKTAVNNSLDKIYQELKDPEIRSKITKILNESQPIINDFVKTASMAVEESVGKVGENAIKIGLNVAEEVPGLGVVIGTIRSADNLVQAGEAAVNAGSQIITKGSDAVNQISQNIDKTKSIINPLNTAIIPNLAVAQGAVTNPFNEKMKDFKTQIPNLATAQGAVTNQFNEKMNAFNDKIKTNIHPISKYKSLGELKKKLGGSIKEFHESTLYPEKFLHHHKSKNNTKTNNNPKNKNISKTKRRKRSSNRH